MVFFSSHQITIKRLRSFGTNKYAYSATFTAYPADIQPAALDRSELFGGRIGKTYEAWVADDVDVKEGDQILAENSELRTRLYSVKAVSTWHGAGLLDHRHLILISQDDDR